MIAREELAALQVALAASAVLARVVVAREQERVRDLTTEPVRHVDIADEPDHRGARDDALLGAEDAPRVGLEQLSLAVEHESHGPTRRHDGERLERCVQRQTAHRATSPILMVPLPMLSPRMHPNPHAAKLFKGRPGLQWAHGGPSEERYRVAVEG